MEEFDKKPLKRTKELQYLSHDHHHGLLLCWKIRMGFKKGIADQRIKKYAHWFFENYLKTHFSIEEETVFSVLGDDDPDVQQALAEHHMLSELFKKEDVSREHLEQLEKSLKAHIRFEERILFQRVQEVANTEQLGKIQQADTAQKFEENAEDPFWL